jgi:dimethylargininase
MFNRAIVMKPATSMVNGITAADLGAPDHSKALFQHRAYVQALETCGLKVTVLDADEGYPDSTFVEDIALLTCDFAILTNPGAATRKGETAAIRSALSGFFSQIDEVSDQGTVDAGDIMMVGSHFYIGISERTSETGARQVIEILARHGRTGSMVALENVLHLKTGVAYLEQNNLIATGEFVEKPEFKEFNILEIDADENYAANCIWVNGKVIVPHGYPKAHRTIQKAGYTVIEVDVSEFRKLDGGLSCLSLRF